MATLRKLWPASVGVVSGHSTADHRLGRRPQRPRVHGRVSICHRFGRQTPTSSRRPCGHRVYQARRLPGSAGRNRPPVIGILPAVVVHWDGPGGWTRHSQGTAEADRPRPAPPGRGARRRRRRTRGPPATVPGVGRSGRRRSERSALADDRRIDGGRVTGRSARGTPVGPCRRRPGRLRPRPGRTCRPGRTAGNQT